MNGLKIELTSQFQVKLGCWGFSTVGRHQSNSMETCATPFLSEFCSGKTEGHKVSVSFVLV